MIINRGGKIQHIQKHIAAHRRAFSGEHPLGCVLAWMNTQSRKFQMAIASVYIEVIRNTPFIVQLFFIFFGLPSLGVKLSPLAASMLAMTINLSAYSAEILRAGKD